MKHILVVDNDPLQCRTAEIIIQEILFYSVTTLQNGADAINFLTSESGQRINLVLLDLSMPGVSGMDVLRTMKEKRPDLPIIIYTAHGDVQTAIQALKEGAVDFVEKQDGPERLQVCIENALKLNQLENEVSRLKRSTEGVSAFSDIIGSSKKMEETRRLAIKVAESEIPVLIKGESGVGKELFARAIHGNSRRAGKNFVAVNCGAIPENLVESVLFGHEKGSFTGATEKTIGKFREADGGTLFLDEIGDLKPDIQVKLLRALQQGEIEPVGAAMPVKVNVRVITATNRSLKEAIEEGSFREDLYYRINVFPFTIPSLRERPDDIAELLEHFTRQISAVERKRILGVSDKAKKILSTYHWPGNVRQLQNVVYRAVVLSQGKYLEVEDFTHIINAIGKIKQKKTTENGKLLLKLTDDDTGQYRLLSDLEKEIITSALEFYDWHISRISQKLGIGRSTLYRKMEEYSIENKSGADNEQENIRKEII